jgi:hypothetical protein
VVLEGPDAVVAHHGDDRDPVPGHRVELHRREAEGAVAEQEADLAPRMRELGTDRLARPGAEAPERARVHPGSRDVGLDDPAGVGDEVSPVPDHDRVPIEHLRQLPVDAQGMERRALVVELVLLRGPPLVLGRAQLLHPGPGARGIAAGRLPDRGQGRRNVPDQLQVGSPGGGQAARLHVEANQLGVLAEGAAEAESEVERDADDEGDVRALQAGPAGAAEAELVIRGQAAASHPVEEHGDPERLG